MKKLMFVAAMVASTVAFGADVSELDVADGVYNIAITQKTLVPTYVTETVLDPETKDEIDYSYETKADATAAGKEYFDTDIAESVEGAKLVSVSVKYSSEEKMYGYQIKYTAPTGELKSSKIASANVAGLLVKGDDTVKGCADGTLFIWTKAKDQVTVIDYMKGYEAFPYDEEAAILKGRAVANKSAGVICLTKNDITMQGAGFGTASAEMVKTVSGQMVTSVDDYETDVAYGTWKIQQDANLTKLGKKGYTIQQLLQKKGAVETKDAE